MHAVSQLIALWRNICKKLINSRMLDLKNVVTPNYFAPNYFKRNST